MIAEQDQFHLPELTPQAAALVSAYLATDEPLHRFAASLNIPITELLHFLTHPAIQAHIDAATALAQARARLRLAEAHAHAVEALARIAADESSDPIERRRAATALFRPATARRAHARPSDPDAVGPGASAGVTVRDTHSTQPSAGGGIDLHDPNATEASGASTTSVPGAVGPGASAGVTVRDTHSTQPSAGGGIDPHAPDATGASGSPTISIPGAWAQAQARASPA